MTNNQLKEDSVVENISFSFVPNFRIEEDAINSSGDSWLKIGGIALEEGTSRNNNVYSYNNLQENNGKEFKFLFGHPDSPEEHVIGLGSLKLENDKLMHEGKVRNTAKHPDVIESIKDGFLGPSIHASAQKVTRKEDKYFIEGLNIEGIGLVAFQGVKNATIDYAIAESFDKADLTESLSEDANNDGGKLKMSEEEQPKELPEEQPNKEEPQDKPEEKEEVAEQLKSLKEELNALKSDKKAKLVESILAVNSELKKEELMKESDDKLMLIKEYETKLSQKNESVGVVETKTVEADEGVMETREGVTLTQEAYAKFNAELRERMR